MQAIVYQELAGEMAKRRITRAAAAKELGISPRTFYAKMTGESDFTLTEAKRLKGKYFQDIGQDKLFHRSDEETETR